MCTENLVFHRDLIGGLSSSKPDAVTGRTAEQKNKYNSKMNKMRAD
jgi:hypothetical protein